MPNINKLGGNHLAPEQRSEETEINLSRAVEVLRILVNIREQIRTALKEGIKRDADLYARDSYLRGQWPRTKAEILRRVEEVEIGEGGFLSFEPGKRSGEICLRFSQALGRSVGSGGHYSEYEQCLRNAGAIVATVRRSATAEYGRNVSLLGMVVLRGDLALMKKAAAHVRDELREKNTRFIGEVEKRIAAFTASTTAAAAKRKEERGQEVAEEERQRLEKLEEARQNAENRRDELQAELAFLSGLGIDFIVETQGRHATLTLPSGTRVCLVKRTPTFSDPDIWHLTDTSEYRNKIMSGDDPRMLIQKYLDRNR